MIAILLCAGYATRMYPITENFPKPLLSVAGRPVIDYLMAQLLALDGLACVHIVTNDRFASHFKRWRDQWSAAHRSRSFRLEIHNDGSTDNGSRLGASRDLAWVVNQLPEPDRMLVSAGDNIFRFPLEPIWRQFKKSDHHVILALSESDPVKLKRTGVLEFGKKDHVIRLHEKPADPPSNWSCPAIYFFQKSVGPVLVEFLKTSENKDAPGHFVSFLCRKSHVKAVRVEASRLDIGSIEDYHQADRLLRKEPVFPVYRGGIE